MSQIIEIGFDISSAEEFEFLEKLLAKLGYKFYVEPGNKFTSLEDLECQIIDYCEVK